MVLVTVTGLDCVIVVWIFGMGRKVCTIGAALGVFNGFAVLGFAVILVPGCGSIGAYLVSPCCSLYGTA